MNITRRVPLLVQYVHPPHQLCILGIVKLRERQYLITVMCYLLTLICYVLTVMGYSFTLGVRDKGQNMTQVISIVQEKGGAGKTTLLTAIASLMVEDGAKVAVIDTDPQRHLEAWAKKDQINLDWLHEENDEKLIPTVKALKKTEPTYDVIFIDTAGFKSAMAIHAIAAANLILIPSKANEADAKGAKRTFSHVQSVAEAMEKEISALVVMMDVDTHTNITQAITDALDTQSVPRLRAMCAHRTGFKEMTSTGKAPQGSAKVSAQSVLADLQGRGLINFYRSGSWQK